MPTTIPFKIERFGGLNLIDDPVEVGETSATDLMNVDLDLAGRLRTRNGWALLGSAASTLAPGPMATYVDASQLIYVIAKTDTAVTTAYNDAGTVVATTAQVPSSNTAFARFGDTANIWLFMADGTTTLRRFNGAAWANVAVTFAAEHLAVMPNSNRLVVASGSRVGFSDAGAPATFGANNFVDLHPGDGESITALVAWRDYVFAFKQTKFFVFGSESTDTDGQPVFNYRTVNVGLGCAFDGVATPGGEGVYFATISGVYMTSGDAPRYLSRAIEPWIRSPTSTYGNLPALAVSGATLAFHKGRLHVTDTTNRKTLVFDPVTGAWVVWNIDASGMVAGTLSGLDLLFFGVGASKKVAFYNDLGQLTDGGAAIPWSYTSGLYDLGSPGQVKVTLESKLVGTGPVTLKVATYDTGSSGVLDTGSALTLGTAPVLAEAWQQIDREGTFFQHQLSGSGAASVSRLVHYVSFVKPAGVQ